MSIEANKALVHRFLEEAWNRKNPEIADELLAPSYVYHGSGQEPGPGGARNLIALFSTAFPDATATVNNIVAEGEQVAVRWTTEGTHLGDFGGLPATGQKVVMTGMEFFRIVDGKVVERWSNSDTLGLLQQLGVVSPA
ncbi:MAG TPA: ester cyclase [Chloroflexia bacterium]|nr:ester cyclase [Chloroflexia bacterium]